MTGHNNIIYLSTFIFSICIFVQVEPKYPYKIPNSKSKLAFVTKVNCANATVKYYLSGKVLQDIKA